MEFGGKSIKKIILSLTAIVFVAFLYLYRSYNSPLKRLGIDSDFLETFSIHKKVITQSKNNIFTILYLKKENEEIKIKGFYPVQKAEALKRMNKNLAIIESVFHPKPTPYFRFFTKTIKCPKELLPGFQEKKGLWREWIMFANDRKAFGVCDKNEISFINYKLLKYCFENKVFIEIDYFIPIKNNFTIKESITLKDLIFCSKI